MKRKVLAKQIIRLIGVVIFIAIILNTDFEHIDLNLTLNEFFLLISAIMFVIPIMMLKGFRWALIAGNLDLALTPVEATNGFCIAQMTSFTLPGSLGDLIRVPFLKCRGNPTDRSILSIFLDAIAASILPYSVAAVSLVILLDFDSSVIQSVFYSILFIVVALYISYKIIRISIWPWLIKARIRRIKITGIRGRFFVNIREALVLIRIRYFAGSIILGGGSWYLYSLQAWILAHALGISADWYIIAMAVTLASIFTTLPISIQGIGVREGVLLLVLGFFGFDIGRIVVYSIILTLISLTPSIWGLISWMRDPFVQIESDALEESILTIEEI